MQGSPDGWPIRAIVGHLAVARVYRLCGVFKEVAAEATPFPDPFGEGWEDRLDIPRSPEELVIAVARSWRTSAFEQELSLMLADDGLLYEARGPALRLLGPDGHR